MIEVSAYATRNQAELAQAALVAAGVQSRLVAHDVGGAYPYDIAGGAHLLVDEADVELAWEILGRDRTHTETGPYDTNYTLGGHRRHQLGEVGRDSGKPTREES